MVYESNLLQRYYFFLEFQNFEPQKLHFLFLKTRALAYANICCNFGLRLLRIPPKLRSHFRTNYNLFIKQISI